MLNFSNLLPLLLFYDQTIAKSLSSFQSPLLQDPTLQPSSACDCNGTKKGDHDGYVCSDFRLGPVVLPKVMPMLSFVNNYDRFGSLTPGDFLKKWTFPENGTYRYPPGDGFSVDVEGKHIKGNITLATGTKVDRFGSENGMLSAYLLFCSCAIACHRSYRMHSPLMKSLGSYVSAADSPYDQRSLPPSSLNQKIGTLDYPLNYHLYIVSKPLNATAGPIAPWFGQPGLGAQFYVGETGNIKSLLAEGYLTVLHKSNVTPGNGPSEKCGR